ncbi:MAG: sulfite exporter TauE/SafE family protein [Acidimicrobiia bacterium]
MSELAAPLGILAGMVAALSGFGIGSLLTPLFASELGTKLAVAAVALPHFVGTSLRLLLLRKSIDRKVLKEFGIASGSGGLCGALLYVWLQSEVLTAVFGGALILAGVSGLARLDRRVHLRGKSALAAGVASGLLGGLVGNQGGIRSAALLACEIPALAFVATGTAVALVVDTIRLPLYIGTSYELLGANLLPIGLATFGVIVGTLIGRPLLSRLPEQTFRIIVSMLIAVLGIYMLLKLV